MIELEKLNLLVNLAKADGNLAPEEREFIIRIGMAHGYPGSSVETLFYEEHKVNIPEKITNEQRVDYAVALTQLMLLDKKMYLKEIEFCSEIIEKLGFEKRFIYKLIDAVGEQETNPSSLEAVRTEANKYLKSE
jgi:uncharacterized tellurite resistance protein B-like protein